MTTTLTIQTIAELEERAVEQERAAWVARIEAWAAEIEAGLDNDGHLMTSNERKSQRHTMIVLRALLPA